jgi:DDE superfamily endonuclease
MRDLRPGSSSDKKKKTRKLACFFVSLTLRPSTLLEDGNKMLFTSPFAEARTFLDELTALRSPVIAGNTELSKIQAHWISVCITAMVCMGMFCFARIQRASAGRFSARAFSWMLHYSKICWDALFEKSVLRLVKLFGDKGFLIIDDSDRLRAKSTSKLFGIQKLKDKKTGGYANGQNIVMLLFVTDKMTFPVGFRFFIPDPAWVKWRNEDRDLRLKKVPARLRPKKPCRSKDHPTKITIAGELVEKFKTLVSAAKITAINADAAYSCAEFTNKCELMFPRVQVISQIRGNQLVRYGKKLKPIREVTASLTPVTTKILLRGKIEQAITYVNMRVWVKSHNRVLHVIALKYDNETEYRYLIATDLTWRGLDVIRAYSTRWLIEVFFQDWKAYDGWGKSACQRGIDGARRGVILSLLVDHFLLSHPLQLERVKAGVAAFTAGSLQRYLQSRGILDSVAQILESPDPKEALRELFNAIEKWVEFRPSDKHMTGREMGEFIPTTSLLLKYKPRPG